MGIRLFDRIAMLVKADAHGLVESLEERSLLLKQYVREAELELDHKRARLEALREEDARLREAVARGEAEIRALDADVTLAIAAGKDDLARFAIRRLLPRRAEIATARAQIEQHAGEIHALTEKLEQQQAQLEALRSRARAELARDREGGEAPPWRHEPLVAEEEVELELMRRRRAAAEGGTKCGNCD
jgi:phage shock protein A